MPTIAPYGSWKSPISADLIVAETVGLGEIALDGDTVYWSESRPAEGGRSVIVRRGVDGQAVDVTPPEFSVLSRVHEYGGGAFTAHQGMVYFVNLKDQGVYRQRMGAAPEPLLVVEGLRCADLLADGKRRRLLAVCEDHRGSGEPRNTLVALPFDGGAGEPFTLAGGADFYSSPALDAKAERLAWLAWNHPNMPWDGTELWVADVDDGDGLANPRRIAGGADESVFQPQWGPDGALYFISDRGGWWNLYRWRAGKIEALRPMAAEFGLPQWVFGLSTYAFDAVGNLICAYREDGSARLARLDPVNGAWTALPTPLTSLDELRCRGGKLYFVGASQTQAAALVELDLATLTSTVLRPSSTLAIDAGYLSVPQAISFPSAGGARAHAFFYPPANRDYSGPPGVLPPLLVKSHGGPTAAASSALNLGIQYWTSRGFALLDVNYRGSTGYGRAYRQALNGQWGIADVDDCAAAARYVAARGMADGARAAIRGNSAGGYTTLAALAFRDVFRAGASYYGVSDLEILARDTHKFESRYMDRLIGPYPAASAVYRERSPIHHLQGLSAPVIFFQGLDDKVVPPNQAELMVDALRRKGVAVAYVPFAGERHGFRQAANIKRALETELYFYSRIFGFPLAEAIEPVRIDNLAT